MARTATIRTTAEFRLVLESGRRSSKEGLTVCVLPTGRPTRVGFVCGRQFGGAVQRNRGRRVMRAAWDRLAPRVVSGFDVVVIARKAGGAASAGEAAEQIELALRSLGALLP